MENQNPQVDNSELTPEEAKASLGIATYLQQGLLPQGTPMDGSVESQNPPGQAQPSQPNEDLEGLEARLMDEITTIKEMIEKNSPKDEKTEIAELKKQIEEVLNSNDE